MKKNEWLLVVVVLFGIISLFFYQTIFQGKAPIPADILVSDFQPWRSTSYLGYGEGGIPNKAQYPDVIRQMYPWKTLVVEALRQGKLPLWNPYNFSGAPLLANFQSAPLYPLGILYLLIPQIDAWSILIILQPLLAMLFTYMYSRKIGMMYHGAVLASLSYGFSGFMAVWLEYNTVGHVILWLPLMLYCIEHLREKPRALSIGLLTAAHSASLLAGHPQVYGYTMIFTLIYAAIRAKRGMWGYIGTSTLLGVGISSIQLLPGIELISQAARSPHDATNLFTKILIQPLQLLSLAFPNYFGNPATRTYWPTDTFVGKVTTIGLVPLFFSLSAFRRKDTITRWFIGATVVVLLLITAHPITAILYRIPIPIFTSSSPTLMSFLFAFSFAMMCGLGLDYWLTDKHSIKKLIRRTLEVIALFAVLVLLAKLPIIPELTAHAPVAIRALMYGAIISAATLSLFWVAIALPKWRTHAIIILLIVHAIDLFIFFNRFNPFAEKSLVFPDHPIITYLKSKAPDRYWGYGTANIAANFASQYHLFSPEGYDPLYPKSYGQFLYSYKTGAPLVEFDNTTRSDAAIVSGFGDGGLSDIKKQHVLNALSVRYILDRVENGSNEEIYPPDIFRSVYSYADWVVYENTKAAPRASLQSGNVTIKTYEPEHVSLLTESSVSGTLILTDTYYPGWLAWIDDTPTTIYLTDQHLRKLEVPAGTHTITMKYKPKSVTYGALLSIVSVSATIIMLVIIHRKKK
jgi:hypothetical protein